MLLAERESGLGGSSFSQKRRIFAQRDEPLRPMCYVFERKADSMTAWFTRCSVIALATFMFSGCGGALPSASQTFSQAGAHAKRTSWILPSAKKGSLMYISDEEESAVYVYTYPKGKLVGSLSVGSAAGMCTDAKGDVWIASPSNNEVVEYAHGGTTPITTLALTNQVIVGCAFDPTSGALAVTSQCEDIRGDCVQPGSVFVYSDITKPAQQYSIPEVSTADFCGYDAKGNLFVDGYVDPSGPTILGELSKGSNAVESISLSRPIYTPGGIQWDGKHLAIGDVTAGNEITSAVYQFDVKGTKATAVGTTPLHGTNQVLQFWIQGSTLVAPNSSFGSTPSDARLYKYPKGGSPTLVIDPGGFEEPIGSAVSLAVK